MKLLVGIILLCVFEIIQTAVVPERSDGGRIVGGVPITISQAAYQVSLLYKTSHICGG